MYRFHEGLDATNAALGFGLTLDTCIDWKRQLHTPQGTKNFAQLGGRSNANAVVLAAVVTQSLQKLFTPELWHPA
ncbi:hypothetical protein PHMEG_0008119 [Phytophthora megakarya]|uniref:Uncharacterized protein n=1 Tax=Phytophthora megakarya TaxID=4795 RepID=A0A225WL89_9STRA|nr:hypothetical protein PHMEG_0008119 [Phytophthora megakarya]